MQPICAVEGSLEIASISYLAKCVAILPKRELCANGENKCMQTDRQARSQACSIWKKNINRKRNVERRFLLLSISFINYRGCMATCLVCYLCNSQIESVHIVKHFVWVRKAFYISTQHHGIHHFFLGFLRFLDLEKSKEKRMSSRLKVALVILFEK